MSSPGISSASLPRLSAEPETRVGPFFILVYGLAVFGVWMAVLTPVIVSMALRVAALDPVNKATILSQVMGTGALVALFANPICGYFSDRTTSRLGMRRPWILGGTVLGVFGLYLVATGDITTITIGWLLAQAGYNAVLAAVIALLPDQVPEAQRGRVSGVLGVCLPLGVLAGVTLTKYAGGDVFNMFMWPAGLAATGICPGPGAPCTAPLPAAEGSAGPTGRRGLAVWPGYRLFDSLHMLTLCD